MAKTQSFLFLVAAMSLVLMGMVDATDHVVGGSVGWAVPDNTTFYQNWAKQTTFNVGDKLVFNFLTEAENVLEVNKKDFDGCLQDNAIAMYAFGPLTLELTEPGNHYYYCGVGLHCEFGQKLSITVNRKL